VRSEALRTLKALHWDENRPLVFLHPGASRTAKQWGAQNYFKTIELLPSSVFPVLIVDDRNQMDRDEPFLQKIEKRIPIFSTKELVKLAAVLSWGKVFVGSDSGIKHLACAVGISSVTLFGPESIGEWHCYDLEKHPVIQKRVGCRTQNPEPSEFAWCGEEPCPLSSHACMSLIFPEEVLTKIQQFL
jgi:heptosyltransferase II